MTENYLAVLGESLTKKKEVLLSIQSITQAQKDLLSADNLDLEGFDACVEKKDELITELGRLDEGFQTLFDKVKAQIEGNKDQYKDKIKELQLLIKEVTDLNLSIQAQEARNKTAVESYFKAQRNNIGKLRKSNKAASDYYKSAYNLGGSTPGMMDTKK